MDTSEIIDTLEKLRLQEQDNAAEYNRCAVICRSREQPITAIHYEQHAAINDLRVEALKMAINAVRKELRPEQPLFPRPPA